MRYIHTVALPALLAVCLSSCSPKVYYSSTEARSLELSSAGYVRPIVVDVRVNPDKRDILLAMSEVEMDGLGGPRATENIRRRAISLASEKWGCDLIVGALCNVTTVANGDEAFAKYGFSPADSYGYLVSLSGFTAYYTNWGSMKDADSTWVMIGKGVFESAGGGRRLFLNEPLKPLGAEKGKNDGVGNAQQGRNEIIREYEELKKRYEEDVRAVNVEYTGVPNPSIWRIMMLPVPKVLLRKQKLNALEDQFDDERDALQDKLRNQFKGR